MTQISHFGRSVVDWLTLNGSTDGVVMPPEQVVQKNRKHSFAVMALSALMTLVVLSVLAMIEPRTMLAVAGAAFFALLVRFVWLVWRELE